MKERNDKKSEKKSYSQSEKTGFEDTTSSIFAFFELERVNFIELFIFFFVFKTNKTILFSLLLLF